MTGTTVLNFLLNVREMDLKLQREVHSFFLNENGFYSVKSNPTLEGKLMFLKEYSFFSRNGIPQFLHRISGGHTVVLIQYILV